MKEDFGMSWLNGLDFNAAKEFWSRPAMQERRVEDKEEFLKRAKGEVTKGEGLNGHSCRMVGEEKGAGYETVLPWAILDFEFNSTDELMEEISKRYDLENVKEGELCRILSLLEQGGAISGEEYWLGQSIVPATGAGGDFAAPEKAKNLVRDYYDNFEEFVDRYGDTYSANAREHLQKSLLAHKKIDLIFQQIQSYRYAGSAGKSAGNQGEESDGADLRGADASCGSVSGNKKAEILEKFPQLTEEKLDSLLGGCDIESMDSQQLYKLAEKLMEEGVIPARPDENGLNQIVVFPKALYDAFLSGDTSRLGGVVRDASGFMYMAGGAGETGFGVPEFGIGRLKYEQQMLEDAFRRFEQYYTEDELNRHIQLANSKAKFLELAKLLSGGGEK